MQHVKHDTFLEDKGFGFYKKRHHLQSQLTLELLSIIVVKKYGGEIKILVVFCCFIIVCIKKIKRRKFYENKKFIVALCFSFFMFMCSVSTVYAYNTYNQHKLTYGVGNYGKDTQHYFITSSASGYASYINTAMSEWVNTTSSMGVTTPISYTKTTTQSSSRMDIYQVSTVNEWWGLTTMYNGSTEVDPFSSNWAWGKIQLDADFSDLSENKRLAVIAHEMGHVMGLAHSDFSNVLMRADIAYNSSSTSRAQTNDLGGINYLYK